MNANNQVIIERDIHCPYCNSNSAVLISETVKVKTVRGCAPLGLKEGCLLVVTAGCWSIISGVPLTDFKTEYTNVLYGFCPCCGNTYNVEKPAIPELQNKTIIDQFHDTKQSFSNFTDQVFHK